MPDRRLVFLLAFLALAVRAFSEDARDAATPAGEGVPVMFLPPPITGTISIGVANGAGKLVRVLQQEAAQDDFKIAENGLVTRWDGRSDAGQPLPPGKYSVGGWCVGDLGIEGVAFHCNDWTKDESPRYTRVTEVKNAGRDEVQVTLRTVGGKDETIPWKPGREGVEPPKIEIGTRVENGKLIVLKKDGASQSLELGDGAKALSAVVGSGDHVWAIVETPAGREVRAYSAQGEFLRRLGYAKTEPQPQQIAASLWEEQIFLLDENETEQRLRTLAPDSAPPAPKPGATGPQPATTSAWKITELKRVLKMDSFDAIAAHLGRAKPLKAEAVAKILTCKNPLLGDERSEVFVKVSFDAKGAVLKTKADLPLVHLTHTPRLKWAALVREGAALTLFQSDGAVVEEFKIAHPENMMSFDAGEYALKAAGAKAAAPTTNPDIAPKRTKPLRPGDDL